MGFLPRNLLLKHLHTFHQCAVYDDKSLFNATKLLENLTFTQLNFIFGESHVMHFKSFCVLNFFKWTCNVKYHLEPSPFKIFINIKSKESTLGACNNWNQSTDRTHDMHGKIGYNDVKSLPNELLLGNMAGNKDGESIVLMTLPPTLNKHLYLVLFTTK